tara:strand:- start:401 stop:907 length:507 start_codon:yes stop_codon:yes gene_type:complete
MVVHVQRPAFNLREKINEISGKVSPNRMPPGSIIQVRQFTTTNSAEGGFLLQTSSSSFTETPLLLAITPKFSTSKILINVNTSSYCAGNNHTSYTIYRDSTNLGGSTYGVVDFTAAHTWRPFSMMLLDTPQTTSSVTYRVYGKTLNNTLYMGGDSDVHNTITLMEVKQ